VSSVSMSINPECESCPRPSDKGFAFLECTSLEDVEAVLGLDGRAANTRPLFTSASADSVT